MMMTTMIKRVMCFKARGTRAGAMDTPLQSLCLFLGAPPKLFACWMIYMCLVLKQRFRDTLTLHSVYIGQYDSPVSKNCWCFFWNLDSVLL